MQSEQLSAQKALITNKSEQLLNSLKFLMSLPLGRQFSVQTEIVRQEEVNYTAFPSLDLRIVQTQSLLLSNELNTLHRSRSPSVSLMANFGLTGFGNGRQPEPFLKFFPLGFIGVQANYTIWGGRTRLQIEQKRMELRNNAIQSDNIQAQNSLMIANATLQRSTAERSIRTSSQQIELAQTVYRQTVLQQEQGTATLADILLADNALREAQQSYLNAIIEYLKADLELKKVTGSIIIANLDYGTDLDKAIQDAQHYIDNIRKDLPASFSWK